MNGEYREELLIIGVLGLSGIAAFCGNWDIVGLVIGGALALLKGEKKTPRPKKTKG